jgi:hypothetical protein
MSISPFPSSGDNWINKYHCPVTQSIHKGSQAAASASFPAIEVQHRTLHTRRLASAASCNRIQADDITSIDHFKPVKEYVILIHTK